MLCCTAVRIVGTDRGENLTSTAADAVGVAPSHCNTSLTDVLGMLSVRETMISYPEVRSIFHYSDLHGTPIHVCMSPYVVEELSSTIQVRRCRLSRRTGKFEEIVFSYWYRMFTSSEDRSRGARCLER